MSSQNKAELLQRYLQQENLQGCLETLKTATRDDLVDLHFLTSANDIHRILKNHEQALHYADALLREHPSKPVGYIRTSQELLALGRKIDAQRIIEKGLTRFPSHPGILTVAYQVFRAIDDFNSALIHAQTLQSKHPTNPNGFIFAAQDLLKLDRSAEALSIIQDGLAQHPDQPQLLIIGINAASAANQTDQSLLLATRLIHSSPDKSIGFIRAAQDLLKLDRPAEALSIIQDGLAQHPDQPQLLIAGINASRAAEQIEIALNFCKALIRAEPDNPFGYTKASQDLAESGHVEASLRLMEQLNQARAGDPTSLKSIRRFYRFLGDRGKSLEASRLLFQSSSETAIEVISDLIALQRIREALSMALAHNLISSTEESSLLTTLESANSHPAINKSTRQAFNTLNIFPHFEDENFNPIQPEHITNKETSTICVIHVGKCAGESVIEALKQSFPEDYFRIIEYHIFDADQLLKNIIPKTTESKNIHWVILSRDPITRWISAFNWDYHLYHLNQYFYCHETAKKYFSRYQNCLELCRAIQNEQDEAIYFSRFNHLTFGHMAMGQAWYLSEDLINQMDPEKTSLIRIEQISEDFESCIKKIRNQFRFAKAFKAKLTPTKNKYQNRYERHTFKRRHDFSDQDVKNLRRHLSDDCKIAQLMRERFVT